MNVLAFDTCMEACSVALIRGEDQLLGRFEPRERGHAEALFPMIEAVMDEAGLGFPELDAIAVTRGPGSFTGVRAGIAAARGLALGWGTPIIAATSLEVMALGCLDGLGPSECSRGMLIAHDARRGELYIQAFDGAARALSEPAVVAPAQAARLAAKYGLVAGSGAALVTAEADRSEVGIRAALPGLLPDARQLARLALHRAPARGPVSPLYLRAPDAKPQMDKHLARA
jgi:tRNA threonylcarbamoyladenosine biosynthesis protein TsaB